MCKLLKEGKEWAEDLEKRQLDSGRVNEEHLGAPVGPPDSYRAVNIAGGSAHALRADGLPRESV